MDTQFTTAAHVLGYLAWRDAEGAIWVSSEELGHSINTHSVVVRRVLSKLRSSGLIETRRGAGGGSRLARPARKIDPIAPERITSTASRSPSSAVP